MRFNSQSVMLNRGTNLRIGMDIPRGLLHYSIPTTMWDEAIADFNKHLDDRKQVSEIVDGVKVDILRIHQLGGGLFLWMAAKEKDVPTMTKLRFTFKGKLVYENATSDKPERILITDLLYGGMGAEKSIFKR